LIFATPVLSTEEESVVQHFDPELERRIRALESASDEGGFTPLDWFLLVALGIVFPAGLLVWGWPW
jgi:hypothetical protein